MSDMIGAGLFPITDRATAVEALQSARESVRQAPDRGYSLAQIENAKAHFRKGWHRRREELGLTDLPFDPFE